MLTSDTLEPEIKQYIWNERDYQTTIINFSKNELSQQYNICL